MQVNREFMFTVDQLELIRRLRNSGLTKEQVLCAFDSFERLDSQVSKSLNIPMTLQALQIQALQRLALTVPSTVALGNNSSTQIQDNRVRQLQQQLSQLQSQQQKQLASLQQQQLLHKLSAAQGHPVHDTQGVTAPRHDEGIAAKSVLDLGTVTDNGNNGRDVVGNAGGRLSDGGEDGEIDSDEMREFFSLGEVACLEEIKDFILKHSIKQQQIAVLAGVSQPYVSRYLRGDFNSMSDRSCRAIKKWYLTYRKNPTAIGVAVSSALLMNNGGTPAPTVKKLISQASIDLVAAPPVASEMEMFSCPRRERFVFRPNHLQILERYFMDDNYPSYDKREDIAKICNESTQDLVGRELTEKETVTVQIVSNWFANKRKDLKKLYKEEGLDAGQVPMRSRGRPSHSYLDSPLIQSVLDHQTNGAQSLEMLATVSADNSSVSDGNIKPDAAADAVDATSLQFSVEIAAVNQAIMSLTGQRPISVKMEKADISEYLVAGQSRPSPCVEAAAVTADMS